MSVHYDEPPPMSALDDLLYGAADAARELGIPAGTVRSWASRGLIYSRGIDREGRPMYSGVQLLRLRSRGPT